MAALSQMSRSLLRETSGPPIPQPKQTYGGFQSYIDPDRFYREGDSTTFIYTVDGRAYYGDGDTAHYKLIAMHRELINDRYKLGYVYYTQNIHVPSGSDSDLSGSEASNFFGQADPESESSQHNELFSGSDVAVSPSDVKNLLGVGSSDARRLAREFRERAPDEIGATEAEGVSIRKLAMDRTGDLFGRIGSAGAIVSFWNEDVKHYGQPFLACLRQLQDDGLIDDDSKVSTPVHGTVPIAEIANVTAKAMTPEQQEQMELYKRLHLMRGGEKQAAMKKLGVGGGGRPHAIQRGLDQAGLRFPGQKWWAPHSESFNRTLDRVLKET